MKEGIHPKNYRLVAFKDMSNETVFITKSTANTKETIEIDNVANKLKKNFMNFLLECLKESY